MNTFETDILVVGAGPVGLMCAYLGRLCGLRIVIVDESDGPLQVGRADALNARTLQLLELVDLFKEIYPLGKTCNTSSVWCDGKFISRQSTWWEELEGCYHKHFLMLGQAYLEKILDSKIKLDGVGVQRSTSVSNIEILPDGCMSRLTNGEQIKSCYVIGADGSASFVRQYYDIPFSIVRPQIVWAVIDGIIKTDFPKVPEIIVFQAETSDVAWIPREGGIDRFYVRMDAKQFTLEEAIAKINRAMQPHTLRFLEIAWFSQFAVKESVAEKFCVQDRVFLAGDACHIHSVNGGQGLNTGLADAFNLIWKLNMVLHFGWPKEFLRTYETERKPVAESVIQTSGELVRATKFSENQTHAKDYVKIVQKRAGNITGMGIRYAGTHLTGTRLFDFEVQMGEQRTRIYSLLDYRQFTMLVFGEIEIWFTLPQFVKLFKISTNQSESNYWTSNCTYASQAVLVRPDSYIEVAVPIDQMESLVEILRK